MKSEESLSKSVLSAFNRTQKLVTNIKLNLYVLDNTRDEEQAGELMQLLRSDISELSQRFHEYNAYRNTLYTE